MSFLVIAKKTNKVYIWLAVDRDRNKVVDFEVSIVRDFASYLPIAMRLQSSYEIEISCSDHYDVYEKFRIAKKHYSTKAETSLVESFNSLIRHYLARFHRKTKRYSKAIDMIYNSILMLFNKDLLISIFS
ncbi:IS1 family transposase [Candidatus Lariskella endosymbiont of Hedychridium roseum]|uniref:IS1 family transposase n=1 Tax=Candidatus Lariskella endosymbiont of Hedychridium roseum TaxID=3077949 RepID=UPI0030D4C3D3